MTPLDIRKLLEGYCLDARSSTVISGGTVEGSPEVTVASLSGVLTLASLSGAGIPAGAYVLAVTATGFTMSAPATATASGVSITVTQYADLSDEWLVNTRDLQVIPMIERVTRVSLSGTRRVTEYHSGTGSTLLLLNRRHVIEVHSVNLITNPQNWVFVSPGSIEVIGEEGVLKLKAVLESWQNFVPAFPRGKDNIKIDYTYGFAEVPADLERAVCMLTASFALGMLGARTGGGTLSTQGYNRSFGSRGKYHDARQELDRWAHALVRKYMTGMVGQ